MQVRGGISSLRAVVAAIHSSIPRQLSPGNHIRSPFQGEVEWNCNTGGLITDLECLGLCKWGAFVRFGALQSHRKCWNEYNAKLFRHPLLASIVQEGSWSHGGPSQGGIPFKNTSLGLISTLDEIPLIREHLTSLPLG